MQFVQSFLLVASILLLVYIAVYSFMHRKTTGAAAFSLLVCTVLIWSVGSFFELYAQTLQWMIFWRNIQQIGVFTLPITSIFFAVIYTRNTKYLKYAAIAGIPPILSIFLIFTNDLHHLMRTGYSLESTAAFGESLVVHSSVFGSIMVSYNFILPVASVLILVQFARKVAPDIRRQVYLIIFCMLLTFATAWIKTAILEPMSIYIEISVLNSPSTFIIFVSIFKHRTFKLSPIARDKVFEIVDQGILVMDDQGTVIDANSYALHALDDYFSIHSPLGVRLETINTKYPDLNQFIGNSQEKSMEIKLKENSSTVYISIKYYPLFHDDSQYIGSVLLINNTTVQRLFERGLKKQAEQDYLTRFLNKLGFQKAIKRYLPDGKSTPYSVLMIDVDNFKQINDSFGHAAGDSMLCHFSEIVNSIIRSQDIAARLGGDEFVIVIPNIQKETARQIAERIRIAAAESNLELNGHPVRYSISIGVADSISDGNAFEEVLENADKALYIAKKGSRNCSVLYSGD